MKKFGFKKAGIAALCACAALTPCLTACGGGGSDDDLPDDPGVYGGITSTTITVGNTAGTTGALAAIGAPFNYGIEAAFWEYNNKGGFTGKYNNKDVSGLKVALKTYDDMGNAANTVTYTDRLIHDDEVFAIVGNFGTYGVAANLDILKEEGVPMVYAAAGNEEMANATAKGVDRFIFPVQPITSSEGRVLIQRAFAPASKGGLGATKVGVIGESTNDASNFIISGIKAEMNKLTSAQKNNVVFQEASDTTNNFGPEAAAIKQAGCDVVIVTTTASYKQVVTALMGAGYTSDNCKILTTYNNATTTIFDKTTGTGDTAVSSFDTSFAPIIDATYSQSWLDISSTTYVYNKETPLCAAYKLLGSTLGGLYDNGVPKFNEEYWDVAEVLYDFGLAQASSIPTGYNSFTLSYNSYALAGYIAGNLFCSGLEALNGAGLELTRRNYVDAMEKAPIKLPMSGNISFQDGRRLGIDAFALSVNEGNNDGGVTTSRVVHGFTTLDEFRG